MYQLCGGCYWLRWVQCCTLTGRRRVRPPIRWILVGRGVSLFPIWAQARQPIAGPHPTLMRITRDGDPPWPHLRVWYSALLLTLLCHARALLLLLLLPLHSTEYILNNYYYTACDQVKIPRLSLSVTAEFRQESRPMLGGLAEPNPATRRNTISIQLIQPHPATRTIEKHTLYLFLPFLSLFFLSSSFLLSGLHSSLTADSDYVRMSVSSEIFNNST